MGTPVRTLQRPVPTLMGKDGTLERPHRHSHAGAWERDVVSSGNIDKKHNNRSEDELNKKRHFIRNKNDANEYDLDFLMSALDSVKIQKDEFIFIASDFFVRQDISDSMKIIETICNKSTKTVLDVVPHTIYKKLRLQEFKTIIDNHIHVMIAELKTLMRFLDKNYSYNSPQLEDWNKLFINFNAKFIAIRYGVGEISRQGIRKYSDIGEIEVLQAEIDTGYEELIKASDKRGFGDILTAKFLAKYYGEIKK
ncbi:MAG: hypothetical protein GY801_37965 [bacterium]|nr:hypothetical protein [bacterium]